MSASAEIASTLQSLSIKRHPSPTHDVNPSTAASTKEPITLSPTPSTCSSTAADLGSASEIDISTSNTFEEISDQIEDEDEDDDHSTIPLPDLRPQPRRANLPPLPDLRFEQSYLASISKAEDNWEVARITFKDQVVMPLVQGFGWAFLVQGWRYWNRGAMLRGKGVGGKVRRWWWGVNGWKIPER